MKIGIIGHSMSIGATVSKILIERQTVEINPAFEPEPIMYKAPEIHINSIYTPPMTRKERRAAQRKNKNHLNPKK